MNETTRGMAARPMRLAVIGAGPVGLALALHAAAALPEAEISLFDARAIDKDVSADPRTLALSLGSVQLLKRLGAWRAASAEPILEVHVSQQSPSLLAALSRRLGEPELTIRAVDEAVPMLGAVLSYGGIVAPLQETWLAAVAREPKRLTSRFGTPVTAIKNFDEGSGGSSSRAGVEIDAGIAECFDLAVIAEGGVFASTPRAALVTDARPALRSGTTASTIVWRIDGAAGSGAASRSIRPGATALTRMP